MPRCHPLLAALLVMAASSTPAVAQAYRGPSYVQPAAQVPAPVDHAFDGTIMLHVDATDVAHGIFTVTQRIPVSRSGPVTLLYPKWEAASHGPSLSVADLAGLVVSAEGKPIAWRRDRYEPHAFHLDPPPGTRAIDVRFQMVAGRELLTPDVVAIPWQRLSLYPAGWYARNIAVSAAVTLPRGLRAFTSLDPGRVEADTTHFRPTSLEALLDAPVLAGRYTAEVPLTADPGAAVKLDIVAVRPGDLAVPAERVAELRQLIAQMQAVFGAAPFRRYEILARLSDDGASGGTEHRSSSENGLASTHFRDWHGHILDRDLIAHEIIHAWNGFHRTPADLWAPTPNVPVAGSLLWMYEGQTEFWGRILAARAGQFAPAELRDRLAIEAAEVANRTGRAWRPLSDDVNYPSFMMGKPVAWRDWQRRRDYYSEGVMLWLAVDAALRERSGGRRSIDDFAKRFFAGASPDAPSRTYTFDDICAALNDVAPADWSAFLRRWLDAHDELDTSVGLVEHGWKLVYDEQPTAAFAAHEEEDGVADLSYSIGLTVTDKGLIRAVRWDGPAFRAGLRPGVRIVAVGAAPYSRELLLGAVRGAAQRPVVLTVDRDDRQSAHVLPYAGTLRYPRLERITGRADTLARLLAPR